MLIVLKLIVCKFGYVFKIGILEDHWVTVFRIMGALLIISGIFIWFTGAVRSDMDDHIESNKLKTSGIYAWVRNPMYSGWWIAFAGITAKVFGRSLVKTEDRYGMIMELPPYHKPKWGLF